MITRCYEIQYNIGKLREVGVAIGQRLVQIHERSNLQQMLKMYIAPLLRELTTTQVSSYLYILKQLQP